MRKIHLVCALLSCFIAPFGQTICQDAGEILKVTASQCKQIENGHYLMIQRVKPLTNNDTDILSFNCYFKRLNGDTLYPRIFNNHYSYNRQEIGEAIYTGQYFVRTYLPDSTATIASSRNSIYEELQSYDHNGFFYEPFFSKTIFPFIDDSGHFERGCTLDLLGEKKISGIPCYYIKVNREPEPVKNMEGVKALKKEYCYWIDTNRMIPLAYSDYYILEMNNTVMNQYRKYSLEKYEINSLSNDSIFSLRAIPSFYRIKTYSPEKETPLLPLNSTPPSWTLNSIKGKKIALSDLKGKVVLLDFFYKSCYPCMLALPKLMDLSNKYRDKGLVVIGIDPVDKDENDLGSFLAKRGITYDIVLSGKDNAKNYHVTGYPTVYIIDKDGKIIFNISGFGAGIEDLFEKYILQAL